MSEKWKKALDKGENVCTIFMDLSKAFDFINNNLSSYKKLQAGVSQGSIDGPLLFHLFINELLLFLSETFLSNYADGNNVYSI